MQTISSQVTPKSTILGLSLLNFDSQGLKPVLASLAEIFANSELLDNVLFLHLHFLNLGIPEKLRLVPIVENLGVLSFLNRHLGFQITKLL